MSAASKKLATFADLAALGDEFRGEVIHGMIVEKAAPSGEHSVAQLRFGRVLGPYDGRGGGGSRGPGGWWFASEADIELAPHEVYRPDVCGWRRERMPQMPKGRPISLRPDWVCEILSPSNQRQDLSTKLLAYHSFKVPHYWIVNPMGEVLVVHRWSEQGYVTVLAAGRGERVRAEPFDAIDLEIGVLFGDDPEEPSA